MSAHGQMKIEDYEFVYSGEFYRVYHDTKSHKLIFTSAVKSKDFVTTKAKGENIIKFLEWLKDRN